MDTSATMLNENASDYSNGTTTFVFLDFPLYMIYAKLCIYLVALPVVFIPTLMVTSAIIRSKELCSKRYFYSSFFLMNLYITNMTGIVMKCGIVSVLLIVHLLGISVNYNCVISQVVSLVLNGGKLLFLPLAVDRVLSVAYPFSYKQIMTMRLATGLVVIPWAFLVLMRISVFATLTFVYYPVLGDCVIIGELSSNPLLFFFFLSEVMATVLIIVSSVYLRHKIIKSNKLFHRPRRNAVREPDTTKIGRMVEILQEQIKPTMSVLIVGGIDGIFNVLNPIVYFIMISVFDDPAGLLYVIEFVMFPLLFVQMLSHSLTYGIFNRNIRKELCQYMEVCSRHSKVVALNGNNS